MSGSSSQLPSALPLGFIIKVLVLSVGISIAIKSWGPNLPLPPTSAVALIMVLLPSLLLGLALGGRHWQQSRQAGNHRNSRV